MKNQFQRFFGLNSYLEAKEHEVEAKYSYELNSELLRWEAFAFSSDNLNMLTSLAGIIIFIIIFTSVYCIKNSFAISITEKMKMYGELASVGATRKQIKKSVIFEGLALGIIRCSSRNIVWNFCNICTFKNRRCSFRRFPI